MKKKEETNNEPNATPKNRSVGRRGGLPSVEWFNPAPSSKDKAWLDGHSTDHHDLVFSLVDALGEADKITIKFDVRSGRWNAILFLVSGSNNGGLAGMAVRGSTPFDAFVLLAYFHLVRFSDGWFDDDTVVDDRWG